MNTLIVVGIMVVALVALIAWVVGLYNGLVVLKNRFKNAFAQIDVQLRRRYDLIPNLIECVKGYAAHEKSVLEGVTQARANAIAAGNNGSAERIAAEAKLGGALKGLMVQMEAYPQLRANENFLQLQEELGSTENKISFARQHYNDTATSYNTAIAVFPGNLLAGIFHFTDAALWQITDSVEREAPKVKF